MREIKCRAWRKSEGKMYGVATVWLHSRWLELDGIAGSFDPNLIEFMQYTGLKDKNGKECYWDDWVSDGINPKFLVTPDYHLLARLSEIEFEIVGNKYEG